MVALEQVANPGGQAVHTPEIKENPTAQAVYYGLISHFKVLAVHAVQVDYPFK